MIIGIDHIALSSLDVAPSSDLLAKLGYSMKFMESKIKNSERKKEFLDCFQDVHDLAFFTAKNGISIELTCHGSDFSANPSNFTPIFGSETGLSSMFADIAGSPEAELNIGESTARGYYSSQLQTYLFMGCNEGLTMGEGGICAIAIDVLNQDRAELFWNDIMGFSTKECCRVGEEEFRILKNKSIYANWCSTVILRKVSESPKTMLDSSGFPCLAFLSTALKKDRETMMTAGCKARSGLFEIEVNRNHLLVEMFRGPDNELLELIQVSKKKA